MPYITPQNTPTNSICWRIFIPDDDTVFAAFLGQLLELSEVENWESIGGTSEQDNADVWEQIYLDFTNQVGCMIGTIQHYVNDVIPNNLLACDGTQYLRVDYPKLYAVLPVALIVDGDNFITPTLENNVIMSSGSSYSPLSSGGVSENILTEGQLANHDHATVPHSHAESGAVSSLLVINAGAPTASALAIPAVTALGSVDVLSTGNNDPIDNLPPYTALKVGIVAK